MSTYFEPSLIDRRWLKARNMFFKYDKEAKRAEKLKMKWLKKYNYYVRARVRRDEKLRKLL